MTTGATTFHGRAYENPRPILELVDQGTKGADALLRASQAGSQLAGLGGFPAIIGSAAPVVAGVRSTAQVMQIPSDYRAVRELWTDEASGSAKFWGAFKGGSTILFKTTFALGAGATLFHWLQPSELSGQAAALLTNASRPMLFTMLFAEAGELSFVEDDATKLRHGFVKLIGDGAGYGALLLGLKFIPGGRSVRWENSLITHSCLGVSAAAGLHEVWPTVRAQWTGQQPQEKARPAAG